MSIKDDIRFAFQKQNNAHVQFVLVNVAVFLLMNVLNIFSNIGQTEIFRLISRTLFNLPAGIEEFIYKPWTIVTYGFAHLDFFHIISNMLFLYFIGRVLEDFIGSRRFINIYILGAMAGGLLYLICYNTIPFYMERSPVWGMIGASAAVNAIVVAAATLSPNFEFKFFLIGNVKLKYVALFLVLMSFLQVDGGNAGGNLAHLGGAGIGYLFIKQLQGGNDLGSFLNGIYSFVGGLINPSKKVKVSYRKEGASNVKSTSTSKSSSITSQAEIDAILDKIAESGYESLSKGEKDKLFNASKE